MIHVYTIVWDEEFMLPHFLKHYEKYADNIIVLDHGSTDRTAEIALAHPKVIYLKYRAKGYDEFDISRTFEAMAKEYPSRWAVSVDCDEFIHNLSTLKDEAPGVLKTTGYIMVGKTGELEDCKKIRMKSFDKPVVFSPWLDVRFGDGRHTVNLPARESKLELWHYKYPSREYYYERNMQSYPRIMDGKTTAYRIKRGLEWYDKHT